jgi:hypothetical protein
MAEIFRGRHGGIAAWTTGGCKSRAMKTAAKIFAYSAWYGFTYWLVFFGLRLAGWSKLEPLGLPIMLLVWFGFVFLAAWFPILLARKWIRGFAKVTAKVFVFVVLLLICTILSELFWDSFFAGRIYNCTDDNLGSFLEPGNWVHSHGGMPVEVVPQIPPHQTMDKPDSIKEGWSIPKLWLLWWSFAAAGIVISASFTFLIFRPQKLGAAQTGSA